MTAFLIILFGVLSLAAIAQIWSAVDEVKGISHFEAIADQAIVEELKKKYAPEELYNSTSTSEGRLAKWVANIASDNETDRCAELNKDRTKNLELISRLVGSEVSNRFNESLEEAQREFLNNKDTLSLENLNIEEYSRRIFDLRERSKRNLCSLYWRKGMVRSEWWSLLSKSGLDYLDSIGRGSIFGVLFAAIATIISPAPEGFIRSDWFVFAPVYGALMGLMVFYGRLALIYWEFNEGSKSRVVVGLLVILVLISLAVCSLGVSTL